MKYVSAGAVMFVIVILLGYLALALMGDCKDNLGGPVINLVAVVTLVLAVGLMERVTDKDHRGEKP